MIQTRASRLQNFSFCKSSAFAHRVRSVELYLTFKAKEKPSAGLIYSEDVQPPAPQGKNTTGFSL